MSRDGSGNFNLIAGNPVTTGTTIASTWANDTLSDIATALTNSIAKNGETIPIGNLPMGGYKHTGVANAAARTDYAAYGQVQDSGSQYLTGVAGADTITASVTGLAAYATGQTFRFVSAGANTGAVTLKINSLSAKAVTKTGTTALAAGDIPSGAVVEVVYDGTRFQLSGLAPTGSPSFTGVPTAPTAAAGTNTTQLATTEFVQAGITADVGYRNRLMNGAMQVAQRGTTATVTAGTAVPTATAGYPCVDRWFVYSTGANVTAEQIAGTGGTLNRLRLTALVGTAAIGVGQRIEALNSADLASQTCTLSVDLASSSVTTVTWTASYATSTDTFGTIATPSKTQIATNTFTINSTVTRYTVQIPISASATTGIEILFTASGLTVASTFTIGNVQLEKRTTASNFESRPYGAELALCQRYYCRCNPDTTGNYLAPSGWAVSTTQFRGFTPFPVQMRRSPTTLEQTGTATDYRILGGGAADTACSSVPAYSSATQYFGVTNYTVASGLVAYSSGAAALASGISAYLGWSAEVA